MNIVFEGHDAAGKSTILKEVAKVLGYSIRGRITRVGPDKVMAAHGKDIWRKGNWVLDRCYWLSDYIYEPIYSGKPSVYDSTNIFFMKDINTLLVHVHCDESALVERLFDRGDELYSVEQIKDARTRYLNFFNRYQEDYIDINTTDKSVETCVNEIITELRKRGI